MVYLFQIKIVNAIFDRWRVCIRFFNHPLYGTQHPQQSQGLGGVCKAILEGYAT